MELAGESATRRDLFHTKRAAGQKSSCLLQAQQPDRLHRSDPRPLGEESTEMLWRSSGSFGKLHQMDLTIRLIEEHRLGPG